MSEVIYCHTCNKDQTPVESKGNTHCPDCGYIFTLSRKTSLPFKKPIAPLIPNRKKIKVPNDEETFTYPEKTEQTAEEAKYNEICDKTQKIIDDGLLEICKQLIEATSEDERKELSEAWTIDLWTNTDTGGYNFDISSH